MIPRAKVISWLLIGVGAVVSGHLALAYVFLDGSRWPGPSIVMQMQLGDQPLTLRDGTTSWNQTAEYALGQWNAQLDDTGVEFRVVRSSTAPVGCGNGLNNVSWGTTVCGFEFGEAIARAPFYTRGGLITEANVVFDNAVFWNSYRGPVRFLSNGDPLNDIRRVALHEFGHNLGLGHPDEAGQIVVAQMTSAAGDFDTLSIDDINGARDLYGAPLFAEVNFPPRDQTFSFRRSLEDVYRVNLGRQPGASHVDLEGAVVWTQEYLRYRVNQCSHALATERVFMQIRGQGIQPVCGVSAQQTVPFPPRDQSLAFRNQLESVYEFELRRLDNPTFVDNEGDVVWIQEYLRLRVNGAGHSNAANQVFAQIRGASVTPTSLRTDRHGVWTDGERRVER